MNRLLFNLRHAPYWHTTLVSATDNFVGLWFGSKIDYLYLDVYIWVIFVVAETDGNRSTAAAGRRHALIMDEVDGMAGNEDRGGIPVSFTIHTGCVLTMMTYHSLACRS